MTFIYTVLGYPLGWIMWAMYQLTHSYVFSLLLFTIITRLILIPFTVKQQKSTARMAMIRPQMEELQKKYGNNKEKLNEELMKLYQQAGYNPMSGCLPLLIQMPILFGLIDVIYKPMTHILRLPSEAIQAGIDHVGSSGRALMDQLVVLRDLKLNPETYVPIMGSEAVDAVLGLNMNVGMLNLTETPSLSDFTTIFSDFNPIIFIPIVAGLTSFMMSYLTTKLSSMGAESGAAGMSMKGMMMTMPIVSTMITFSVPAGVGLYWCFSNVIGTVQSFIMNKVYNPKEMAEKAKQELEERREKERQERIEAKKLKKQGVLEDDEKALSQKEINRRKLAEARRRDAEKYGEEYVDVTDDDLK